MSALSDYLEAALLDHEYGIAAWTAPGIVYLALSTASPADDVSTLAEPTETSYCRKGLTNDGTEWSRAASLVDNDNDQEFVEAGGSWGTISHFAIFDKACGQRAITGVNSGGGAGADSFEVAGDITNLLVIGELICVTGSTGNDGGWTIRSGSAFAAGTTTVNVDEDITDATVDGILMVGIHDITAVSSGGGAGADSVGVDGDVTGELVVGAMLRISGSTGNDGILTIRSGSSFGGGTTTVNVEEDLTDATVDGKLWLLGNMLRHGALATSKAIGAGDSLRFPAGDIDSTMD